jgi:hypothetical protein
VRRLAVVVALAVVPPAAALPANGRSYLPLQPRNEWTFEDLRYGGESALTVTRASAGVFGLEGFPGAPELRVRWSSQTLQAWDPEDRWWEALLRLGARAGTTYAVDLPQPLWRGVQVTVASRRATVHNPVLRRSYSGAIRLAVRPDPDLADAGLTELCFAPRVGLVRWVEESIAGPVEHVLASARIGGTTIGGARRHERRRRRRPSPASTAAPIAASRTSTSTSGPRVSRCSGDT